MSLVRAFADAITDRDVEWALELCHPEVEFFSLTAQLEASPYRGYAGIRKYFKDVDATWEEWRLEVEQLLCAPDGQVVIVMSTHMRGKDRLVCRQVVRRGARPAPRFAAATRLKITASTQDWYLVGTRADHRMTYETARRPRIAGPSRIAGAGFEPATSGL